MPTDDVQEEVVNIQTDWGQDGSVNLSFSSHGRHHQLQLTESKLNLSEIPIRLLGSSKEFEQAVIQQVKVR